MSNGRHTGLLGLGLALAAGLVIATWIAASTLERIKLSHQTITVKGYAEREIRADLATWSGSFSVSDTQLVKAYDLLEGDRRTVLAYLQSLGLEAEEVKFSSVDIDQLAKRDAKGNRTNEIEKYELSQVVSLESKDLKLIQRLAHESTALIREGVLFQSHSPRYYVSSLETLKIEMLGQATANARKRAATLAEGSGADAGRLVEIRQGVFQITPPRSTDVSSSGINDTSTIGKVIKAVVTAEFSLR